MKATSNRSKRNGISGIVAVLIFLASTAYACWASDRFMNDPQHLHSYLWYWHEFADFLGEVSRVLSALVTAVCVIRKRTKTLALVGMGGLMLLAIFSLVLAAKL